MTTTKQQLAVPAYFVEMDDSNPTNNWTEIPAAGSAVGFVVPEYSFSLLNDPKDSDSLAKARAKFAQCRGRGRGQRILGYVDTAHGQRPRCQVTGDINNWYCRFPDLDGIFFDDGPEFDLAVPVEQKTDQFFQGYYLGTASAPGVIPSFKQDSRIPGPKLVMLNASQFPNDWVLAADVVIVWEQSWDLYQSGFHPLGPDGNPAPTPQWWRDSFDRVAHIIHTCPPAQTLAAISRSEMLNAKYVYVYDLDPTKPDPETGKTGYFRLPKSWADEVGKVSSTSITPP